MIRVNDIEFMPELHYLPSSRTVRVEGRRETGGLFLAFEFAVTILTLLYMASEQFLVVCCQNGEENDRLIQVFELTVYALFSIALARWWRRVAQGSVQVWPVFLLALLATFSSGWSAVPGTTFRRGLILVMTTLFGVYFGARFRTSQQLKILAIVLAVCAVLSVAAALFAPGIGISPELEHAGDWRGIFSTKNVLARTMTLSLVVFLLLAGVSKVWRVSGLLLSAGLVIASGSKTGEVVSLALVFCFVAFHALRWPGKRLISTMCLAASASIAGGWWIAGRVNQVAALLGRDVTLSGRDDLWSLVTGAIALRPWLGYGFEGFWIPANKTAVSLLQHVGWDAPHAHNGFLDLALDLGLIGVAIFLAGLIVYFVRAFRGARQDSTRLSYWPLLYCCFFFFYNLTESTLFRSPGFYWALYVSAVVSLYVWQPGAEGEELG